MTAGIHGSEYACIAAALELGQSLEPEGLRGRVVVVPIANMPAFLGSLNLCLPAGWYQPQPRISRKGGRDSNGATGFLAL